MGGHFAARVAGLRVAEGFQRLEHLESDRRYAFVNFDNPWVARLDGGFTGRFAVRMGLGRRVSWSSDGLLYAGGHGGLYRLDPGTGAAIRIHPCDQVRALSVSPAGDSVAFSDTQYLYRYDRASDAVTALGMSVGLCIDVDWERGRAVTAQGEYLFAVDLVSGERATIELAIRQTPAGPCHVRPDGGGIAFPPHTFPVAIAADGRVAYVKNLCELRLIDGRGGDRRLAWIPGRAAEVPLVAVYQQYIGPTWSADGRFISAALTRVRRRPIDREQREYVEAHADEYPPAHHAALGLEPLEGYLVAVDLDTRSVGDIHRLAHAPVFEPA